MHLKIGRYKGLNYCMFKKVFTAIKFACKSSNDNVRSRGFFPELSGTVIKHLVCFITYTFALQAKVLGAAKILQPSLIFVIKVGTYLIVVPYYVLLLWLSSGPIPQILDLTKINCWEVALFHIMSVLQ
jgi:hypothetical protein